MKLLTSFAASAVVSATMLVAPLAAMAQERIAVGSVNGSTIYLDEIMAVAQTLPPEYREAGLANLYSQLGRRGRQCAPCRRSGARRRPR